MLGGHTACIDIAALAVCGAAGERVEVCLRWLHMYGSHVLVLYRSRKRVNQDFI